MKLSWEGIRGVAQWLALLLMAGVACGAWCAQHYWKHIDEYVDAAVQQKLQEILPAWTVDYARVAFDPAGQLSISDLSLSPPGANEPAIRVARLHLRLDSQAIARRQVIITHVSIDRPELHLHRSPDGHWNYETFTPPQLSSSGSPNWEMLDGRVIINLDGGQWAPSQQITCERIELRGLPEASRRYLIKGDGLAAGVGRLLFSGMLDPGRGEWELYGKVSDMRVSRTLLDLAGNLVPGANEKIARVLPGRNGGATPDRTNQQNPVRLAGMDGIVIDGAGQIDAASDPVSAEIVADFRLGQTSAVATVDYELDARISNGRLTESIVPIPLHDLNARIRLNPRQFVVEKLSATNGRIQLFVDGGSLQTSGAWHHKYLIKATSLQLDERIQPYLPRTIKKIHDALRPSGTFDIDVDLELAEGALRSVVLRRFHAVDCRVLPSMFAYPLTFVTGDIVQQGDLFHVAMTGMAGDRPVTLDGTVTRTGDVQLHGAASNVPMDEVALNALQLPSQAGVRGALEMLRMTGLLDIQLDLVKGERTNGELKYQTEIQVHDATMNFTGFPYPVENVAGTVKYDPLQRNAWSFSEVTGTRGPTRIAAEGFYDLNHSPGILGLKLSLVDVPIDDALKTATVTASAPLRQVWTDYGLSGEVDIERVEIGWSPGIPPLVALEGIQWRNGTLHPTCLPYSWSNVSGMLHWRDDRLSIHSLQGWHEDTYLHVDGSAHRDAAYILFPREEKFDWQLHLEDLKFMKLNPGNELRAALPANIAAVLRNLNLQGNVDLQCGCDLKSWNDARRTITAQWTGRVFLDGNSLQAGIPISDVHGNVELLSGEWDGERVDLNGYFDLTRLRTLSLPFTRIKGPLRVAGNRVIVGTPAFSDPPENTPAMTDGPANPMQGKQLSADIHGGRVGLDIETVLHPTDNSQLQYRADVKMSDVDIAQWAKDQEIRGQRLRGKSNGEVSLSGQGTDPTATIGQGWLDATPAELYELPVMAQMFSLLKFRPADDAAFRYGFCEFQLRNGAVEFSEIQLVGDALMLAGQGFIGYAGPRANVLNLDFYSKMENQFTFFQPVVELFGNKWIRVKVQGTVDNPSAIIQPQIGPLDTALGGLLKSLEGPPRRTPPMVR